MKINASDNTQYGSAANGMTYSGLTVGSGFDVQVRRESPGFALVNVMSTNGKIDCLGVLDVEPDQDLQEEAVSIARHPDFPGGWLHDRHSDAWEDLTERWESIEVQS